MKTNINPVSVGIQTHDLVITLSSPLTNRPELPSLNWIVYIPTYERKAEIVPYSVDHKASKRNPYQWLFSFNYNPPPFGGKFVQRFFDVYLFELLLSNSPNARECILRWLLETEYLRVVWCRSNNLSLSVAWQQVNPKKLVILKLKSLLI